MGVDKALEYKEGTLDDQIDTIKNRLEIYHNETEPLKGYYEAQGKLSVVEGQGKVEETTALTMAALEA